MKCEWGGGEKSGLGKEKGEGMGGAGREDRQGEWKGKGSSWVCPRCSQTPSIKG
jgi:hypothetical protein